MKIKKIKKNKNYRQLNYVDVLALRKKRQSAIPLQRGQVTVNKLGKPSSWFNARFSIVVFICSFLVVGIKHWLFLDKVINPNYAYHEFVLAFSAYPISIFSLSKRTGVIIKLSFYHGITWAALITALYLMMPVFRFFVKILISRRIPTRSEFENYTAPRRVLSILTLSAAIVFFLSNPYAIIHKIFRTGFDVAHWNSGNLISFAIITIIVFFIVSFLVLWKIPKNLSKIKPSLSMRIKGIIQKPKFSLYLGKSTGKLINRKHPAGMAANQNICLSLRDAILNILVLGGLGGGKTNNIINPILLQLMDGGYGGLIFDIKGSFKHAVTQFAQETDRSINYIGSDNQPINIIDELSPETAAEYIRAAITLDNADERGDTHWLEAANQLATSVLGLLHFFPKYYSLEYMHIFLYDNSFRERIQVELDDLCPALSDQQKRLLKHYRHHYDNVFAGKYEKYQQSVTGTLDKALSSFTHPNISDAFCAVGKAVPNLNDTTNGQIYLLDFPLHEHGSSGKIIYMLIKLRFFNVVKQRQAQPNWNFGDIQYKPIFFLCDEYQEIIDCSRSSLSDLNFWDKAKDAKCIGIISAQSMNSFYAKIGNRDEANTVLQNFRQKICFKTEDKETLQYFEYVAGKVEVERYSYSKNEGKTKHDSKSSRHKNSGESLSFVDRAVIDPQVFRNLEANEAVVMLNIDQKSMDDIICVYDTTNN